jgi:hypothetical protein
MATGRFSKFPSVANTIGNKIISATIRSHFDSLFVIPRPSPNSTTFCLARDSIYSPTNASADCSIKQRSKQDRHSQLKNDWDAWPIKKPIIYSCQWERGQVSGDRHAPLWLRACDGCEQHEGDGCGKV